MDFRGQLDNMEAWRSRPDLVEIKSTTVHSHGHADALCQLLLISLTDVLWSHLSSVSKYIIMTGTVIGGRLLSRRIAASIGPKHSQMRNCLSVIIVLMGIFSSLVVVWSSGQVTVFVPSETGSGDVRLRQRLPIMAIYPRTLGDELLVSYSAGRFRHPSVLV